MESCITRLFLRGSNLSRDYGKVHFCWGVRYFAGSWQSPPSLGRPIFRGIMAKSTFSRGVQQLLDFAKKKGFFGRPTTSGLCKKEGFLQGPWQSIDGPAFLASAGLSGAASALSQSLTGFGCSCQFRRFTCAIIPMTMGDFLSFSVLLVAAWKVLVIPAVGNS